MKIVSVVLALLFSSSVFAHNDDKITEDKLTSDRMSSTSNQYSSDKVQDQRSLKHKYVTRKNSMVSPTSPSNKKEWRAKAAAENRNTDFNDNNMDQE